MTVHPRDIILLAGSEALHRYGTFTARQGPADRDGEGLVETVTRSGTTATRVNRRGIIEKGVAANVLRQHWLDLDGDHVYEQPVVLIERAATNLLLRSEEFDNAAWTKVRSSIGADAVTAPDDQSTGDLLIEDATASNTHYIWQDVTATADANYAVSVFVNPSSAGRRLYLRVHEASSEGNRFEGWIDPLTGIIGTTQAAGTGALVRSHVESAWDSPTGWHRFTIVGSVGNGATSIRTQIGITNADGVVSYSGDGSSMIRTWGAQFEDGAQMSTSYVGTAASTQTRNADGLKVPYYATATNITVYAKFIELGMIHSGAVAAFLVNWYRNTASGGYRMQPTSGGNYRVGNPVGQTQPLTAAPALKDVCELAIHVKVHPGGEARIQQSINGGAVSASAYTSATSILNEGATVNQEFYIGSSDGAGTDPGTLGLIALAVARGEHELADMRAVNVAL